MYSINIYSNICTYFVILKFNFNLIDKCKVNIDRYIEREREREREREGETEKESERLEKEHVA